MTLDSSQYSIDYFEQNDYPHDEVFASDADVQVISYRTDPQTERRRAQVKISLPESMDDILLASRPYRHGEGFYEEKEAQEIAQTFLDRWESTFIPAYEETLEQHQGTSWDMIEFGLKEEYHRSWFTEVPTKDMSEKQLTALARWYAVSHLADDAMRPTT